MKDFLYLFIGGHEHYDRLSPEEMQANMKQWTDWIGQMSEKGIYKGGNPLEAGGKTIAGANKVVTDGPFAESKEVVGGYVMITAPDLDQAVEVAKGCPIYASGGRVEVRQIREMNMD